jgi:hypothetical protein
MAATPKRLGATLAGQPAAHDDDPDAHRVPRLTGGVEGMPAT